MTAAVADRLAQLSRRFDLPAGAADSLERLLALLASHPAPPTSLRDPATAVDAHVADALVALEIDAVRAARRIADLGAGAGFPGLVLAAALPRCMVELVEANARKCAFLARAIDAMQITNAKPVVARAEAWAAGRGRADIVTARALAPLNVVVEYGAPLLVEHGSLVAWKGRRDAGEEHDGGVAARATGLAPGAVRAVRPWTGAQNLHLHVYVKVGPTPNRYPRRPGMASKRPLRARAVP
jgi:16S rRNA (guanine527-N7)-methyltransferase